MARNSRNDRSSNRNRGRDRSDQPLFSGWKDGAKERPLTTAAAVGGAVAAGVFLWSRRSQISDQLGQLSDQIGEWTDSLRSGEQSDEFESVGDPGRTSRTIAGGTIAGSAIESGSTSSTRSAETSRATGSRATGKRVSGRGKRKTGTSETGGGNASFGAHTGTPGGGAGS